MSINIPRIGQSVKGSTSGEPIMVLFDLLSRRWAIGIMWQLNDKTLTFRALQDACGNPSPTVLNTRLKELSACALINREPQGYALTPQGKELIALIRPLGDYAKKWCKSY